MDPNQFNLRWNNHSYNIVQVFLEQLTTESLVDVTLSCQGQFIKAHKMVLSACSPYFQDLFNVHQVQHPVIILNGVKFTDLKIVVEFMYRGETRVLESELNGVFSVAEALQIKGLCSVRKKYIKVQNRSESTCNSTLSAEAVDGELFSDEVSDVTGPDPIDFLDSAPESPDPPRKRKRALEREETVPTNNSANVSPAEPHSTEPSQSETGPLRPGTPKPTSPIKASTENSTKRPKTQSDRPAKVYSARKPLSKKSGKSLKSSNTESTVPKDQEEENTEILPFVQVSLNEADDDDIDLTSAIKVNPLFIRDIDDTDTSWDDPSRLVIDLPPEEMEGKKEDGSSQDLISSSNEKADATPSEPPRPLPKLKVRSTLELISASKSSASPKSPVNTSKPGIPGKQGHPKSDAKHLSDIDKATYYKKQQILYDQLKEKTSQPPRPPNAFMIFANEWRKKLALENPTESNKQISVRLGLKWKGLEPETKAIYFSASKQATEDHKKKYPNYIYSPKEARLRKALICSLRHEMHSIPKDSFAKSSDDPLNVENDVGTSSSNNSMQFIADENVVVKEELLDDEPNTQNFEEEFYKIVEGGHVEAEMEGEGEGLNCETVKKDVEEDSQEDSK